MGGKHCELKEHVEFHVIQKIFFLWDDGRVSIRLSKSYPKSLRTTTKSKVTGKKWVSSWIGSRSDICTWICCQLCGLNKSLNRTLVSISEKGGQGGKDGKGERGSWIRLFLRTLSTHRILSHDKHHQSLCSNAETFSYGLRTASSFQLLPLFQMRICDTDLSSPSNISRL